MCAVSTCVALIFLRLLKIYDLHLCMLLLVSSLFSLGYFFGSSGNFPNSVFWECSALSMFPISIFFCFVVIKLLLAVTT